MNKVLVLLATYNGEIYLREQLDSILNQQDVEVHILVRDDGSSDGTLSILEEYQKTNTLDWYTGEHLNVQKGYYDLMKKASCTDYDFFAFSDQDDVWDRDKLMIGISAIHDNDIPGLYYCGQRLVDSDLSLIEEHRMNPKRSDCARFLLNDAAGCTEVFNRKLLEEVISYTPEYMLMHDAWILKVCLATGGRIYVDSACHMSYRQHGNNVVGLKRDFKSKVKRAVQYINEQKVEPQMLELKNGYSEKLATDFKDIIEDVLKYKHDFGSRLRLMKKNKFYYGDSGIQLTYYLKIILNKL